MNTANVTTAKEKSIYLIEKFRYILECDNNEYFKECLLICIDEIHRYQNWNQELKNIYDTLPDLKIIFSGSSSLDLIKGKYDLSRRVTTYNLDGLSFREYLRLAHKIEFKQFSFNEIIKNYQKLSSQFIKHKDILKYFNQYLSHGYYPFFKEVKDLESLIPL